MLTQIKYLRKDLKTWRWNRFSEFVYLLFESGVWAVVVYRISRSLFLVHVPVVRLLCRFVCLVLFKFSEAILGVSLPPVVPVGPGLHIGHTGLIVINHGVKIGNHLSIAHGVTIGTAGVGKTGSPAIGDNVFIGAGAKVIGNISVGNNVKIGANAVVTKDIPDNATAVGIPARVVNK